LIDPLLQLLFLRCLEQQRNIQLCLLFLALNCNLLILSYLAAHTINLMVAERIRSQEQPCKHPTHGLWFTKATRESQTKPSGHCLARCFRSFIYYVSSPRLQQVELRVKA
jgi:hypothetical protein